MTRSFRGVVKGNVVLLQDHVHIPDEAVVEVRLADEAMQTDIMARIMALRAANAQYRVGIDEIIDEDRREREEHPDTWMASSPPPRS